MKIIKIENWNRKEHYEFFSQMANPMVGIVTEVECTAAYEKSRDLNLSFFSCYLHTSMVAVNSVKELKYRIIDNQVIEFDTIHAGTTIGREDGTFGFAYIPYSPNFNDFHRELQREIQEVKLSSGLRLSNDEIKKDLIRHSTFPWNSFTGLLHPNNGNNKESVPRITFGKYAVRNGRKYLPVSIEAHHGLVDGLHIANYLEEFQRLLSEGTRQ